MEENDSSSVLERISILNIDLQILILSHVEIYQLCILFKTNRLWRKISEDENLWRLLYFRRSSIEYENAKNWKSNYLRLYNSCWENNNRSTLSNNNLTVSKDENFAYVSNSAVQCKTVFYEGVHYWSILVDYLSGFSMKIGITYAIEDILRNDYSLPICYTSDGKIPSESWTKFERYGTGDRIGVFVDIELKIVIFFKNGKMVSSTLIRDHFEGVCPSIVLPYTSSPAIVTADFEEIINYNGKLFAFHGACKKRHKTF